MSHKYKNYFRPPFEYYNAITLASSATLLLVAPWMVPKAVAYPAAGIAYFLATYQWLQGREVERFHNNLREPKPFKVTSAKIPKSNKALWLGLGFLWTPIHTQRYHDAKNNMSVAMFPKAYTAARENEGKASFTHELSYKEQCLLPLRKTIAKCTSQRKWWNPVSPYIDLGGTAALHGVEPNETHILQPIDERSGHTLVLGATRVGKTRAAEGLIAQDCARKIDGTDEFEGAVIVFDPKGDGDLYARTYIEALRNGRKFYNFHLGFPEISARYNGVADFNRVSECATRTSGQLNANGDGAAFREFVWRFINMISQALFAMKQRVDFDKLNRYIQDMESIFVEYACYFLSHSKLDSINNWESEIALMQEKEKVPTNDRALAALSPKGFALYKYIQNRPELNNTNTPETKILNNLKHCITHYDSSYFSKITASLLPLLEKLTSGRAAELIAPDYENLDDDRPIISWSQVLRQKAVVYVGLDAMQDQAVASAVGNTMFADLLSTSGEIYKFGQNYGIHGSDPDEKSCVYIHADEFNELCGDEFLPLVNKAGGSGVKLTCYTQSRFDLDAKVGTDKAEVILSNFNTVIMMRVKTKETAKYLTDQLPEVNIRERLEVSGTQPTESLDFKAKNEDRYTTKPVPIITEPDIIGLPKGEAFCYAGGRLYKVRFPLILRDKNEKYLAPKQSELVEKMKSRYNSLNSEREWWVSDSSWMAGFVDYRSMNSSDVNLFINEEAA